MLEVKRKELEKPYVKPSGHTKSNSLKSIPSKPSPNRRNTKNQFRHINKPLMTMRTVSKPVAKDYAIEIDTKEGTRSRNPNESYAIQDYIKNATAQKARDSLTTNNLKKYRKKYGNNSLNMQVKSHTMSARKELSNTVDIISNFNEPSFAIGHSEKRMSQEMEKSGAE
jgi:hypothetical protein